MKHFLTCLVTLFFVGFSVAQTTLRGTIRDANNQGVAGALVTIEGTSNSTLTAADGSFSIQLTDGYETLVITAEGYQTQKIYLTGQTSLSVSMQAASGGDGQVNFGIGAQSKDELTSSVSSIAASDVSPAPLINLEQANQGVTAGLFVQNSSGTLGQPTQVRIRGGSSLSASNQPLYVVDGVPLTSQNQSNINPSNIASIEILKDASATAIYGTRAANGVIIITTKSGNSGKMQVNVDYQYGVSETPKTLDIQTGDEHLLQTFEFILRGFEDFSNGLLFEPVIQVNGNTYPEINRAFLDQFYDAGISAVTFTETFTGGNSFTFNIPGFYDNMRALGANTDWQNEVFQKGTSHRANIDFQGGTEKLGYFTSIGYTTQEGILVGNTFDRFNGSLSLNSQINEKLSANVNMNFIYTKDNRLNENQDLGFPLQAIVLPPSDEYDPSNNYNLVIREDYNPLTEINYASNVATNNSMLGSLGLKYKISEQLTVDVNGGIDFSNFDQDRFQGPQTQEGAGSASGRTRLTEETIRNSIFNGWLTYTKPMGSNQLSVIVGGSYQRSKGTFTFSDSFFPNSEPFPGSASAFISGYTRVNYALGEQFDFQVSGRMDGSSKFSKENRYGFFPAASAGWKAHNAPFLEDIEVISQLKLRASYGLVGNAPTDDFLYQRNYFRSSRYGTQSTLELANLANDALKWETTSQLNVGLDFGILDDRISGSFDYYIKTTTDLLFPVPVTQTTGFAEIFDNIGEMENKGFEVNLSTVNVNSGEFSWTTDFNVSSNENTIKDLKGEQAIVGVNAFLEGQPAGVLYMREYVGVDPATGDALYSDGEGGTTTDWENAPRQVVGNPNPKLFGGLTNSIAYKNFEFSFMFQFVTGVDLYFQTGEFLANSGILNLGQLANQSDRWYAPGDDAPYPRLDPFNDFPQSSSRWVSSGDYVRLKNITLTYNMPTSVLESLGGLRNLSIYVGATNLLTFTDYIGYDPDVSYFDPLDGIIGQNISRGVDQFNTPQPRIIMSGIKIGL